MRRKPHECMSCLLSDIMITMIPRWGAARIVNRAEQAKISYTVPIGKTPRAVTGASFRLARPSVPLARAVRDRGAPAYIRPTRSYKLSARKCPSKH